MRVLDLNQGFSPSEWPTQTKASVLSGLDEHAGAEYSAPATIRRRAANQFAVGAAFGAGWITFGASAVIFFVVGLITKP